MITSYPAAYTSGHVTKEVKDAMRQAASRREDRSMSQFTREAVQELLDEEQRKPEK